MIQVIMVIDSTHFVWKEEFIVSLFLNVQTQTYEALKKQVFIGRFITH